MKQNQPRGVIPYAFTPLPKSICTSEYYKSPQLLVFLTWVFSRVALEDRNSVFNGSLITLERGEFIFGRRKCSEETGISEQSLRTLLKNLRNAQLLTKISDKSTNKYSVYKVFLSHFGELTHHLSSQQISINQPLPNHNQEKEAEVKESSLDSSISHLLFPAHLNAKALQIFNDLLPKEKQAVVTLFAERNKRNPILHPSQWILKCIQEKWYIANLSHNTDSGYSSQIERNKELALSAKETLKNYPGIICHVRRDILEISHKNASYQVFYHEQNEDFESQLKFIFLKLGLKEFLKKHQDFQQKEKNHQK